MAQGTTRDRIWSVALNRAIRKGEAVYPAEIAEKLNVSERTARDCLKSISGANFLKRDVVASGEVRYLAPDEFSE